jgi:hypothetical protein
MGVNAGIVLSMRLNPRLKVGDGLRPDAEFYEMQGHDVISIPAKASRQILPLAFRGPNAI